MIEYKNLTIPSTSREWELYTDSKKCQIAARALTEALKNAITYTNDNINKKSNSEVLSESLKIIVKVQEEYVKLGAYDSEPSWAAERHIIRAMKLKLFDDPDSYEEI